MFKPISFLSLILLLFISTQANAQGENNIWCFGEHQGLDFNSGSPILYPTNIWAFYSAASVCDANGNLLFYSSGTSVQDRNGVTMVNGTGISGNTNATQGAGIAKSFTNPDLYYLFTINGAHKLYYTVVDMSQNFGLGAVVAAQKNVLVDSNVSDKMFMVRGVECIWLLVHKHSTYEFHAFRIDNGGINPAPVISQSGFYTNNNVYMSGEMKVSNDTRSLVLANFNNTTVELHSFNNVTGVVYNPIKLDSATGKVFGASFSPDDKKLYIAKNNGTGLFQYDLSLLPDVAAVQNSKTQIANVRFGGMRLGPDNKIYITALSAQYSISVINDPNQPGPACNYMGNAFGPVAKGNAFETGMGIPFVPYCAPTKTAWDTTVCFPQNSLTVTAPSGFTHYIWSDSTTLQTNTFSNPGTKWVYAYNGCDLLIDTFTVNAQMIDTTTASNAKDTTVCFVNNTPVFTASPGYTSYLWSDGFTQQTDSFSAPGVKWVYQFSGCSVHVDTFSVHAGYDTTWVTKDTALCVAYIPRVIAAQAGFTSYLWSDGSTQQTDTFLNTGTKTVTGHNACNLLLETINFTATNIPQDSIFTRTTDSVYCFEYSPSVILTAPGGYTDYLWSDGAQTVSNTFNGPGTKWLYAQKGCVMLVDTFVVAGMATDTTSRNNDTDACFKDQMTITAAPGYVTYLWNDGNNTAVNTFTSSSVNWVSMHKACAQRIDTFNIRLITDLSVDIGNDTFLCKGDRIALDATSKYADASYKWQNSSTAAIYNATIGGTYWVMVSVGVCSVTDTVRIQNKVIKIDLGNGKVPCGKDELVLDAGVENSTYTWQDGSTAKTYSVRNDGTYSVQVSDGSCTATASIKVTFEGCPCVVYIPSAFSPNNDGKNDLFGPSISCPIKGYQFMIYNRWGNRIFYTENYNERWKGSYNGSVQDENLFYYYVQFKDEAGHNFYYKGDVTVVQ